MRFEKWNGASSSNVKNAGAYASVQIAQSNTESESQDLNRTLWGVADHGDDISSTMWVNGSIYVNTGDYSNADDEELEFEFTTRADDTTGGNLYVQKHLESQTAEFKDNSYSHEIFLNYPNKSGAKTNILEIFNYIMPKGSIIMHNGSVSSSVLLQYGWGICDGGVYNGVRTPDLRDKFIRGCSPENVGTEGGKDNVALTINNLPAHTHTANVSVAYAQRSYSLTGEVTTNVGTGTAGEPVANITTYNDLAETNSTTGAFVTADNGMTGGNEPFSVTPPFYSLVYIMRL